MKHVVSVSIGSSKRDHKIEVELLGEKILIERRGTDGDLERAAQMLKELDGESTRSAWAGWTCISLLGDVAMCCATPSASPVSHRQTPSRGR